MAKFDDQLSRMAYLMEYKMPKNEVMSNLEYHANGADGKVYGILREGTKYYIKTTESGKENISESYEYICCINNRKENEYKSYNDATKHLELKLMSLNEAYGKHSDVSTVDFKRSEKMLNTLTEEARKDLDRMHAIFENSNAIGSGVYKGEDTESKGKASDPKSQGTPFGDGSSEGTHEKGTSKTQSDAAKANKDYTDASKGIEAQMTSTKMPKGGKSNNDYKDAHDDLDGEGVADKKPSGGKAVMVNEGITDASIPLAEDEEFNFDTEGDEFNTDGFNLGDPDMEDDGIVGFDDNNGADDGMIFDDGMSDVDSDGMSDVEDYELGDMIDEMEELISGGDKSMTGPGSDNKKNSISMENGPASNPINEDEENHIPESPSDKAMTGPGSDNKKNSISMENGPASNPINESTINRLVMRETKSIMNKYGKKETLKEAIDRIVAEETTRLDAWGKHPRFRKEPMTLPQNKEVLAGTADRDWNDDSAKGEQPYGQKIGNGAPFEKTVDILTDAVLANLKESFLKKK